MSTTRTESMTIASRYAAAMFALADAEGTSEPIAQELNTIAAAMQNDPALANFLKNPLVDRATKAQALSEIAKKAAKLTRQSLSTLAEQGRAELLPYVAQAFASLVAKGKGELVAEITSARPLTAAMEKQIADALKKATGKTVKMEMSIDPSVLGGVRVKLGSQLMDATLSGALSRMKTNLLNAS